MSVLDFEPEFFLYHTTPFVPPIKSQRAAFSSANDAYIWQEGNRGQPYADLFHFENVEGERVVLKGQRAHPGHAYAILEALDRTDTDA